MSAEENKELARRIVAALNAWDFEAMAALTSPDFIDHAGMPGQSPGLEGVRQRWAMMSSALSDTSFEIHFSVAEGDLVSSWYTFRATHTGDLMGMPATGKSFEVPAIDMLRFENGKLAEHWGLFDMPLMMMQLGMMPGAPKEEP